MNEKIKMFMHDYQELVKRHKVDWANYPMFVPDGKGGFRVIIQSTLVEVPQNQDEQFVKEG
jgi:hypothetical protein